MMLFPIVLVLLYRRPLIDSRVPALQPQLGAGKQIAYATRLQCGTLLALLVLYPLDFYCFDQASPSILRC